jgi:colicin import membrane protein
VLKERPIGFELVLMLIFSLGFHLFIVAGLILQARISSRIKIPERDSLSFMMVTPVDRTRLKKYKNKLPPPIVKTQSPRPKMKKKAKIVARKEKKSTKTKQEKHPEKDKEKESEEAIAKALSDIYSDLETEQKPRADNYNLDDFERGLSGLYGSGIGKSSEQNMALLQYTATPQSTIRKHWYVINKSMLKNLADPQVMIAIRIDDKGFIIPRKLAKPSGNSYYDRSITRAIDRSDPLPLPPEILMEEVLKEGIVFDFNPTLR